MKKLFILSALFGFCTLPLTGCGGHKEEVIEAVSSDEGALAPSDQQEYEEMMRQGGSSPSSQPKN